MMRRMPAMLQIMSASDESGTGVAVVTNPQFALYIVMPKPTDQDFFVATVAHNVVPAQVFGRHK